MYRGLLTIFLTPMLWANVPPQPVSVSPNSGQGTQGVFTFTFQDDDGADDIVRVQLSLENLLTLNDTCMFYYTVATNDILIRDGSPPGGWSPAMKLGTAGLLSNSRCNADMRASSAVKDGNKVIVQLAVSFYASATNGGTKSLHAEVLDQAGVSSDWQLLGTFTMATPSSQGPTLASLTPNNAGGNAQQFQLVYSDPTSGANITKVRLVIGESTGVSACSIEYQPMQHVILLKTDDGNGWLDPATEAGANNVSNTQCLVDVSHFGAVVSGQQLITNFSVVLKAPGTQNINVEAINSAGKTSGLERVGTYQVAAGTNVPPAPVTMTPNGATGTTQLFRFVVRDREGGIDVQRMQILFNRGFRTDGGCVIYASIADSNLSLMDDAGTTFSAPVQARGASSLQNFQCRLDAGSSTVSVSLSDAIVTLQLAFSPSFAGPMDVWVEALDSAGSSSSYQHMGTWNVPLATAGLQ